MEKQGKSRGPARKDALDSVRRGKSIRIPARIMDQVDHVRDDASQATWITIAIEDKLNRETRRQTTDND